MKGMSISVAEKDLDKAVSLYKKWHKFDPKDIREMEVPLPKGEVIPLGKILRLDYTSDKWHKSEVYYYHHFRKNHPYLGIDKSGNLFILGYIQVTPAGIDDWKTKQPSLAKLKVPGVPEKTVTKLGVLEMIEVEDQHGERKALLFGDRLYVAHPKGNWTYMTESLVEKTPRSKNPLTTILSGVGVGIGFNLAQWGVCKLKEFFGAEEEATENPKKNKGKSTKKAKSTKKNPPKTQKEKKGKSTKKNPPKTQKEKKGKSTKKSPKKAQKNKLERTFKVPGLSKWTKRSTKRGTNYYLDVPGGQFRLEGVRGGYNIYNKVEGQEQYTKLWEEKITSPQEAVKMVSGFYETYGKKCGIDVQANLTEKEAIKLFLEMQKAKGKKGTAAMRYAEKVVKGEKKNPLPKGTYYCPECGREHKKGKGKGTKVWKAHRKYASAAPKKAKKKAKKSTTSNPETQIVHWTEPIIGQVSKGGIDYGAKYFPPSWARSPFAGRLIVGEYVIDIEGHPLPQVQPGHGNGLHELNIQDGRERIRRTRSNPTNVGPVAAYAAVQTARAVAPHITELIKEGRRAAEALKNPADSPLFQRQMERTKGELLDRIETELRLTPEQRKKAGREKKATLAHVVLALTGHHPIPEESLEPWHGWGVTEEREHEVLPYRTEQQEPWHGFRKTRPPRPIPRTNPQASYIASYEDLDVALEQRDIYARKDPKHVFYLTEQEGMFDLYSEPHPWKSRGGPGVTANEGSDIKLDPQYLADWIEKDTPHQHLGVYTGITGVTREDYDERERIRQRWRDFVLEEGRKGRRFSSRGESFRAFIYSGVPGGKNPMSLDEFARLPRQRRTELATASINEWFGYKEWITDVEVEEVDPPSEDQSGLYQATGYDQGRPFVVDFVYDPQYGRHDEEFEFTGGVQVLNPVHPGVRYEKPPYGRYYHEELAPKEDFDPRSFRTVQTPGGEHMIRIGCPAGEWDPDVVWTDPKTGERVKGRCRVGTRAVSILHPLKETGKLAARGPVVKHKRPPRRGERRTGRRTGRRANPSAIRRESQRYN